LHINGHIIGSHTLKTNANAMDEKKNR